MEKVIIDGHTVDARDADKFYNGSDGSRVTDEQWDTSRDRVAHTLDDLRALGFKHVGSTCPEGHEIAEAVNHGSMVAPSDALGSQPR